MAARIFLRSKIPIFASIILQNFNKTSVGFSSLLALKPKTLVLDFNVQTTNTIDGLRQYHGGRPRGPFWRGKKLIGKEALFVILGLKRIKDDAEKLQKFIKTYVLRLLKMDIVVVLVELERQEETFLTVKELRFLLLLPNWISFKFS